MNYKGECGKLIERHILQARYKTDCCPKNNLYDLNLNLNSITYKNVSIKCTKNNTIFCGSVFNFISSFSLELIVVSYQLINNNLKVLNYYLFPNLDLFFINLNKNINFKQLDKLQVYLKSLNYPFSKNQRKKCHSLAKLSIKRSFCGFRLNVKLSKTNKRIQCSLKIDHMLNKIEFKLLDLKKTFKIDKSPQ